MNVKESIQKFYNVPNNKTLIEKYLQESLFDVIGKNRSESAHTNFLKWFFSQDEWNLQAIRCFLKLICANAENNGLLDYRTDHLANIDWDKSEVQLWGKEPIRSEYPCVCMVNNKKQTVRVDLVMNFEVRTESNRSEYLKIVLENKIDSPETNDQTWKYYVYFSNDNIECSQRQGDKSSIRPCKKKKTRYKAEADETQLFVLLSPYTEVESKSPRDICNKYVRVSYQELYDDVLKEIFQKISKKDETKRKLVFLESYMHNLTSPVMYGKDNKKNMAFEKEDLEALQKFWNENLSLFSMAAEAVVKYSTNAEEVEAVSNVRRAIQTLNSKSSYYDLRLPDGRVYEGLLMKEAAHKIVSYLLKNKHEVNDIKTLLPDSRWLQSKREFLQGKRLTKDVRYSDRRNLINGEFYLSNQWTSPKFTYFKDKLHEAFPEIRITLHESE